MRTRRVDQEPQNRHARLGAIEETQSRFRLILSQPEVSDVHDRQPPLRVVRCHREREIVDLVRPTELPDVGHRPRRPVRQARHDPEQPSPYLFRHRGVEQTDRVPELSTDGGNRTASAQP